MAEQNHDDPWNPYFIHPSDNPGMILVSQPLTVDNYNSWSRSMIMALNAKNKFMFIDGSLPKPDGQDPHLLACWIRNNSIVSSWILNSVSKDMVATLLYCPSAAAIWTNLRNRFAQQNGPKIYKLLKELSNVSQGDLSVHGYFTKHKTIWEEISDFRPVCNCV